MKAIFLKNYFYLFSTQIISFVSNLLLSVYFPKVFSIEVFGYWQIFLFYSSYVGLFHFGVNDGVYLRYGGKNLDNLNLGLVKAQFYILTLLQIILAFCFVIFQFIYGREDLRLIFLFVCIYMIFNNLTSFLTSLFQALNDFKIFSTVTVLTTVSFLFLSVCFISYNTINLTYFMVSYVFTSLIGFLYVLFKSKKIFKSQINWFSTKQFISEFQINSGVGFFLMISSISSMLLLGVGRFLIEKKWGVITFGIVSFSITLTTFMLFFIRQIGVVIFPLLKRITSELQKKYFVLATSFLNVLLLACLLLVPLVQFLIGLWLPKYVQSLEYFILIIPMVVYEGKIQIILNTYMKAFRKEKELMYINLLSLLVAFLFGIVGYYVNSIDLIIISMTLSTIVRGVLLEHYLNVKMALPQNGDLLFVFLMVLIFTIANVTLDRSCAWFLYLFMFIIYFLFHKSKILLLYKDLR